MCLNLASKHANIITHRIAWLTFLFLFFLIYIFCYYKANKLETKITMNP